MLHMHISAEKNSAIRTTEKKFVSCFLIAVNDIRSSVSLPLEQSPLLPSRPGSKYPRLKGPCSLTNPCPFCYEMWRTIFSHASENMLLQLAELSRKSPFSIKFIKILREVPAFGGIIRGDITAGNQQHETKILNKRTTSSLANKANGTRVDAHARCWA